MAISVVLIHLIPSPHDTLYELWVQLLVRCVTEPELVFSVVTVR